MNARLTLTLRVRTCIRELNTVLETYWGTRLYIEEMPTYFNSMIELPDHTYDGYDFIRLKRFAKTQLVPPANVSINVDVQSGRLMKFILLPLLDGRGLGESSDQTKNTSINRCVSIQPTHYASLNTRGRWHSFFLSV